MGSSQGLAGSTAPTPRSSLALGPGRSPDEEGYGVTPVFIVVIPGLNGAPNRREEGWVIRGGHYRQKGGVGRRAPSPFPLWTTSSCDWQWAEALAGLKPGPGHWHQKYQAW